MITSNTEVRVIENDIMKIDIMRKMECAFWDTGRYTEELYMKICAKAVFMAAFMRNIPCGYIAIYANDYSNYYAYISSIAVSPKYQKMGIGQAMLDKAIETACQLGMREIRLEVENSNFAAIQFYKKNFFQFERRASMNTSYMIRESFL